MNRARRICALLTLFALAAAAASADKLYLRGAEEKSGRLQRMTEDSVVFQTRDGDLTLPKTEILRVQLQRPRMHDDIDRADQITDPDLRACLAGQPAPEAYPADGYVTLLERHTYDLTEPGVVKETYRRIAKVLQQRGESVASVNVWYFEDTDEPRIDFALTVTPDGRVLHLSDAALKNESIHAQVPDYRRLARYRFACKEPRPGSIVDVQYSVVRRRTAPFETLYVEEQFRDEAPIVRKEVVVLARRGQESFTLRSTPEISAETSVVEMDGVSVDRTILSLPEPQAGIRGEPLMPPLRDFAPHLTIAVPTSWGALAGEYAAAMEAATTLPEDLRTLAVKLFEQGGIPAIHNHVARNIRTVPVPFKQFAMTPKSAAETAQRGIANELDKTALYYAFLRAAGVDCVFTFLRDRGQGALDTEIPSMRAFSSCALYLPKEKIYTTAVSDLLPFDVVPSGLQGAPALLVQPGAQPTTTPLPKGDCEVETTEFDATLNTEGDLTLSVTYSGKGNLGAWIRSFKDMDDQALRNQLEQIAGYIHPATVFESYEKTDLADLAVEPRITLTCRVPGYAVTAGEDLMMLNIPTIHYSAGDVGRPEREYGLFWPQVAREQVTGAIRLPEGFRVYAMPNKVKTDGDTVAYSARLKKRNGQIMFSDTFDQKVVTAPASAYAEYKACKEARADLARQRIFLTRRK